MVLVLGIVFGGPRLTAAATSNRVAELKALCESPVGNSRRLVAIEELCELDSDSSRDALEKMASCKTDLVAALAIAAIGREDKGNARAKLQSIFESSTASDFVRSAAMQAWARAKKRDGKDWNNVRGYLEGKADGNDRLEAAVAAVKTNLFGEGGE